MKKLVIKYQDLLEEEETWPPERTKWATLVLSLVAKASGVSISDISNIFAEMDALNLLDVDALSSIPEGKDGIDQDFPHAKRIVKYLSESGFSEEDTKNNVLVMHEAAKCLKERFNGKIQKYLRIFGQQMIDELSKVFSFSKMNESDVRTALTQWLQAVMDVSVSLTSESLEAFCKEYNCLKEEVLEAADRLDYDLALVDRLIDYHVIDLEEDARALSEANEIETGDQEEGKT